MPTSRTPPLERALADKCLDLYRIVAEKNAARKELENILFSHFVRIRRAVGYAFDERDAMELECTRRGDVAALRAELGKLKGEG